jgi:hypothetical protein
MERKALQKNEWKSGLASTIGNMRAQGVWRVNLGREAQYENSKT